MQAKRVAAFRDFADDVARQGYPERRHEVWMDEAEAEAFLKGAASL